MCGHPESAALVALGVEIVEWDMGFLMRGSPPKHQTAETP